VNWPTFAAAVIEARWGWVVVYLAAIGATAALAVHLRGRR
jgi:hypothetical protein